jgi:hypothetical protein
MEKARAAVESITGKRGHNTNVTESVAPAVTGEHIKPTRHEEIQEAVDREVNQTTTTNDPADPTSRGPP